MYPDSTMEYCFPAYATQHSQMPWSWDGHMTEKYLIVQN